MEHLDFFKPRRLAHVNLWVDDIGRSESFYRDTCGLMIEFTEPDLEATFMGVGHTQHDLGMMKTTNGVDRFGRDGVLQIPGHIGKRPGLNHIAWEVHNESGLVEAWRNLAKVGVSVDTTMDHQIAHSIYLFDPDGNYNEFYCDTTPDWRSVLHGEMGLITSRWDPESAEGFTDSRVPVDPVITRCEQAPLQPARITHLVLATKKMEEMLNFYAVVGGMQVVAQHGRATYLRCSLASYRFGLVLVEAQEPSYRHTSFELEGEAALERSLAKLREVGAPIVREVSVPWKRSVFLRDPDGLVSEWYVPRPGSRSLNGLDGQELVFAA